MVISYLLVHDFHGSKKNIIFSILHFTLINFTIQSGKFEFSIHFIKYPLSIELYVFLASIMSPKSCFYVLNLEQHLVVPVPSSLVQVLLHFAEYRKEALTFYFKPIDLCKTLCCQLVQIICVDYKYFYKIYLKTHFSIIKFMNT